MVRRSFGSEMPTSSAPSEWRVVMDNNLPHDTSLEDTARRDFLKTAGRFATVTTPAVTVLLGTSLRSQAIAASTGARPAPGDDIGRGGGPNLRRPENKGPRNGPLRRLLRILARLRM